MSCTVATRPGDRTSTRDIFADITLPQGELGLMDAEGEETYSARMGRGLKEALAGVKED